MAPPADSVYLRAALGELERLRAAGGWGAVDAGPILKPGQSSARVPRIRERLQRGWAALPAPDSAASTEDASEPPPPEFFDAGLEAAVRHFQSRHGLDEDGMVGPLTVRAMNVSVEDRIRQILINLEHRREFIARPDSALRVLVNVPGFQAWIFEEGRAPVAHRLIVGRVDRPTPTLSSAIAHVVLAPYWNIPPMILARDKLPLLRSDRSYLQRSRMTVLARATGQPVAVESIPWNTIPASEFNSLYWIRQEPGPANALGDVKFMFPNPFAVYLHDTPDRHLFARGFRSFSSGCMRLERPMELAERLLTRLPGWDAARIQTVVRAGRESWIPLPSPVPIDVVYWSAWADADGTVHLHTDLYGLDAQRRDPTPIDTALSQCAPLQGQVPA